MRSPIKKRLHALFSQEFETRYPQFSPWDKKSSSFFVWKWQVGPQLVFFTTLQCLDDDDAFLVEIAFSENGEFPWTSFGPLPEKDTASWRERVAKLWKPKGQEPPWDLAPEIKKARKALAKALEKGLPLEFPAPPSIEIVTLRIKPNVDDALRKFHKYAVPVFNSIAQHRGLENVM